MVTWYWSAVLIIAGMSNFKEVHGKLRLYVSFLEYARHVGQLCRRRRRPAYAPTSNTAGQDNHEKINSWVSFIFPLHDEFGAPLGGPLGRRSSAKIQPKPIDLGMRLWGITAEFVGFIPQSLLRSIVSG